MRTPNSHTALPSIVRTGRSTADNTVQNGLAAPSATASAAVGTPASRAYEPIPEEVQETRPGNEQNDTK